MGGVSRLLCLIGSGETSASMVSLHAEMMEGAGSPPAPAVMLDTSYGFQENADEISSRAQAYFQVKVGRPHHGLRVITEGLDAGDHVIVSGLQRARPGAEVTSVRRFSNASPCTSASE